MRLYHGSNTAFCEVDLSLCRPNKDFGQGFYLAPDRIAAERMAKRTVRRFGGKACLMTFEFDEALLADVPVKRFQRPSEEWAMFVMANRRPNVEAADHNRDNRYGMVVGPVANDDLALLFRQFALPRLSKKKRETQAMLEFPVFLTVMCLFFHYITVLPPRWSCRLFWVGAGQAVANRVATARARRRPSARHSAAS